jgi:hypothetical protein
VEFGVIQWKAAMCLKQKFGTTSAHSAAKAKNFALDTGCKTQRMRISSGIQVGIFWTPQVVVI